MLEVRNLRAGYGALNVLWDVSAAFPAGELSVILGPNGAGKTSLLRAITAVIPVTHGETTLSGVSLAGYSTWEIARRGMVMIPEGRLIFHDMNVEENLLLGAFAPAQRVHARERLEEAYTVFPRLAERRKQQAASLSGGEAQMLAMARGLMSDPDILLIDEPSLGLAPLIVRELFDLLGKIKARGKTLVLVEQNTALALEVADRVYLLRGGKVVLEEAAAQVDSARLHDLYFAR